MRHTGTSREAGDIAAFPAVQASDGYWEESSAPALACRRSPAPLCQPYVRHPGLRGLASHGWSPNTRLVEFRSERYAMVGDGFELRPWSAPTYAYGDFEGLRGPVRGAAVWTLPDGSTFPYIEVELTEVEFDPPLPV